MEITTTQNENEIIMAVSGRLDTNAAPKMIEELDELLIEGVESFVLDMADCDYVASSGLRAILGAQKKMNNLSGTMVVKNVVSDVMEVFEMTGFADILNIQ